jgi:hypothetical protein
MRSKKQLYSCLSFLLVLGFFLSGHGVTPVSAAENTPPTADPQTVSTVINTPVEITLTGSDLDGDELYFFFDETPEYGYLSGESPAITYTPTMDYSGEDRFSFGVYDGTDFSELVYVTITIGSGEPEPPVAYGLTTELAEDSVSEFVLQGNDTDGDMTFQVLTNPVHGTLSGTAPNLTYTPDANYYGVDGFLFRVVDEGLTSDPAEVKFAVMPVNDVPVADGQVVSTDKDVAKEILLVGSDVEGEALTYSVVTSPSHGTLDGTPPELTYTPASGFFGEDAFTFTVSDGSTTSDPATVQITVNGSFDPLTVFFDDFESDMGWFGGAMMSSKAGTVSWERAVPQASRLNGVKQLARAKSGDYDLVTGALSGLRANSYDVDGGVISIRSPQITLPEGYDLTLSFNYYFAHASNSSRADYLKVKIVGATNKVVLREFGAAENDDATWAKVRRSLNDFAGQSIYILIEVKDGMADSLVEAAIDNVLIIAD